MYEVTIDKTKTFVVRSHNAINQLLEIYRGHDIVVTPVDSVEVNTTMEQ